MMMMLAESSHRLACARFCVLVNFSDVISGIIVYISVCGSVCQWRI